jgi:hypothetical protein
MPIRTVHTWERAEFMAADQPDQQPPPIGQKPYESSLCPDGSPEPESPGDQDHLEALVAEARAQGPLPGPRPDPQQSHRPPLLPHLPDVERDTVDAIIGRVLSESPGA